MPFFIFRSPVCFRWKDLTQLILLRQEVGSWRKGRTQFCRWVIFYFTNWLFFSFPWLHQIYPFMKAFPYHKQTKHKMMHLLNCKQHESGHWRKAKRDDIFSLKAKKLQVFFISFYLNFPPFHKLSVKMTMVQFNWYFLAWFISFWDFLSQQIFKRRW